ncbi:MAG: T9SS type A sorting domain-containing protein [Chitinophagales bacterium]
MKNILFSIAVLAISSTTFAQLGLTALANPTPYDVLKEVDGKLYGHSAYLWGNTAVYQIDENTGAASHIATNKRQPGPNVVSQYLFHIGNKVGYLDKFGVNTALFVMDTVSTDSILSFPTAAGLLEYAVQIKGNVYVKFEKALFLTDLTAAGTIQIDQINQASWLPQYVAGDSVLYYTKNSSATGKSYFCMARGATVEIIDSVTTAQQSYDITSHIGASVYLVLNPMQYGQVVIKKVTGNTVQTLATVGNMLYNNGVKRSSIGTAQYITMIMRPQAAPMNQLFAYNILNNSFTQLTNFTTDNAMTVNRAMTGAGNTFVNMMVNFKPELWITNGTASGTKFYAKDFTNGFSFEEDQVSFDLPSYATVCEDYPLAGMSSDSLAPRDVEYFFGKASGMQKYNIAELGSSSPRWFHKLNGITYFLANVNPGTAPNDLTLFKANFCELHVGLSEISAEEITMQVAPNPSAGFEQVTITTAEQLTRCELYDLTGRMVWQTPLSNGKATLNASLLAPGMYTVKAWNGEKTSVATSRLIKD